jgi:hypothetical protein
MHIKHKNARVEKLGHDGREYTAIRDGIFEVPDEVGVHLTQRPDWEVYLGDDPYEVRGEPKAKDPVRVEPRDTTVDVKAHEPAPAEGHAEKSEGRRKAGA